MRIDVHTHLLPGIDDGAQDLDSALALARLALADGTTHLVCTPHIQPRRFDNDAGSIRAALQAFSAELDTAGIGLKVAAAAEVHFGLEIMQGVTDGSLPFLGRWNGKPVLLLEFPYHQLPFGAERLTDWLIAQGILPMIAHPERNQDLVAAPDKLRRLVAQGCLIQLTAASLTGHFGRAAQTFSHDLLAEGMVTVLASDAHNLAYRPPLLSEGLKAACAIVGDAAAQTLVSDNPWRMVESLF
ncbi:capsular biosynthesis protein [Thiohalocapsa marina]|uniref:protein-tyrosine-phosphatase n=1 Tax=Thiohalocapsa marina TaxID=424902 RepID=A0A5M8FDS6_9GAMM|nr:CpsB/CapC family capsule biosynthesis tyrosine phosphatase [Thiohalocapsa marina]KAA6181856.1 capsular biosynthesis protein [Thiohalocapsa marina]